MFLSARSLLNLGFIASFVCSQSTPIAPSQDPWYTAPNGFEQKPPGAVLRVRSAPGNLSERFPGSSSAWNLLFRTRDNNDKPSWAVTTVFIPKQRNSSSVVSYQIPYDTPYLDAASPSYQLYNETVFAPDGDNHVYFQDIQAYLSKGWFVNVPDMTGHKGAFLSLTTESRATIDSMRAVLTVRETHKTASWAPSKNGTHVALYGFSGGALTSEFVAELLPTYAPELSENVVGAALNSMPGNITTTILNLGHGAAFAGLIPSGLVGLGKSHPKFNDTLIKALTPANESKFLSVEKLWFEDIIGTFYGEAMDQYFSSGSLEQFLREPEYMKAVQGDAIAGQHGVPRVPLWSFQSVTDEVSDINETKALFQRYCNAGSSIELQINAYGGHLASQTNGGPAALQWLTEVLSGSHKQPKGCSFQQVSVGEDRDAT